jgi:hypothetical protein
MQTGKQKEEKAKCTISLTIIADCLMLLQRIKYVKVEKRTEILYLLRRLTNDVYETV